MATPRNAIRGDSRLTPARLVPSASNVRRTRLVAGVGSSCWTPDTSMMFIVTRTATQCSAWVQISRHRASLPSISGHFSMTQTTPMASARNSQ